MDSLPIPLTPMLTGAAADQSLDRLTGATNSRREIFLPALRAAHHGFGVPGRLAPPSARGLRAWVDGTEELRLRLEPFGWRVPADAGLDSSGLVVSVDGATAIAMVAGDASTGKAGQIPQVKYARGPVASENVQGSFFDGFRRDQAVVEWWYLLHEMSPTGWHAELALPTEINAGWVTRWKYRIHIVADGPDDGMSVKTETAPELPTPTVRWRESA